MGCLFLLFLGAVALIVFQTDAGMRLAERAVESLVAPKPESIMVGKWRSRDGTSYEFRADGSGVWAFRDGSALIPFQWSLVGKNVVNVKGLFGGDQTMPIDREKNTFVFTYWLGGKEPFRKVE